MKGHWWGCPWPIGRKSKGIALKQADYATVNSRLSYDV